jgi:hypothetical protein
VSLWVRGAPYAPFLDPRAAKPPGLSPLDPADWITVGRAYAAQMAERAAVAAREGGRALAALPEAAEALDEFRAALLAHLAARPEWRIGARAALRPDGVEVALDGDPLADANRLCREDFLLMEPGKPEYRLVAGALCFPSRWLLEEKLGRAMTSIHAPVPKFDAPLAARVNRVFAAIRPEAPMVRVNWMVPPTATLSLMQSERVKSPSADLGRGFWLRTERQTLIRLPRTRVVVFGVCTDVTPVEALTADQRAGLRAALAEWDAAEIVYRGGAAQHAGALAALA